MPGALLKQSRGAMVGVLLAASVVLGFVLGQAALLKGQSLCVLQQACEGRWSALAHNCVRRACKGCLLAFFDVLRSILGALLIAFLRA